MQHEYKSPFWTPDSKESITYSHLFKKDDRAFLMCLTSEKDQMFSKKNLFPVLFKLTERYEQLIACKDPEQIGVLGECDINSDNACRLLHGEKMLKYTIWTSMIWGLSFDSHRTHPFATLGFPEAWGSQNGVVFDVSFHALLGVDLFLTKHVDHVYQRAVHNRLNIYKKWGSEKYKDRQLYQSPGKWGKGVIKLKQGKSTPVFSMAIDVSRKRPSFYIASTQEKLAHLLALRYYFNCVAIGDHCDQERYSWDSKAKVFYNFPGSNELPREYSKTKLVSLAYEVKFYSAEEVEDRWSALPVNKDMFSNEYGKKYKEGTLVSDLWMRADDMNDERPEQVRRDALWNMVREEKWVAKKMKRRSEKFDKALSEEKNLLYTPVYYLLSESKGDSQVVLAVATLGILHGTLWVWSVNANPKFFSERDSVEMQSVVLSDIETKFKLMFGQSRLEIDFESKFY